MVMKQLVMKKRRSSLWPEVESVDYAAELEMPVPGEVSDALNRLRERLGSRYVVYGEWLYARHTVYYDALPHYFLEFDVLDRQGDTFLSTDRRRDLLAGLPIASAPVLYDGAPDTLEALTALVGPCRFKSPRWRERLIARAGQQGLDVDRVLRETDPEITAEGLYLKLEEGGRVVDRLKWVRASFLQAVEESGSHWLNRPIIPNLLADDVDIYSDPQAE